MRVIALDTTALVQDFHLRSAAAHIILDSRHEMDSCILLPEPVIEEACAVYSREMVECRKSLEKTKSRIEALTEGETFEVPDLDALVAEYAQSMRSISQEHGWKLRDPWRQLTVAAYPSNLGHADIFGAIEKGRAPFLRDDRGYKDFVIWRSIVEWLSGAKNVTSFWMVSSNHKDFALDEKLHPDLVGDLEFLALDPGNLAWSPSLTALTERHIKPLLTQLLEAAAQLTSDPSFIAFLQKNLEAAAKYPPYRKTDSFALPCFQDSTQVESLESIYNITVDRVYELESDLAAEGTAAARSIVTSSIPKDMLSLVGEEVQDMRPDEELAEHAPDDYYLVTLRMKIEIRFSVRVTKDLASYGNLRVETMSGGSFDFLAWLQDQKPGRG